MNKDDAAVAMSNHLPVVDTWSGEIGVIETLKPEAAGAMVLYLGNRLARLTKLDDLDVVREGREVSALTHYLKPAGKVHGGQEGAVGK